MQAWGALDDVTLEPSVFGALMMVEIVNNGPVPRWSTLPVNLVVDA